MEKISFKEFLFYQPSYPSEQETDRFYYRLCCELYELAESSRLLREADPHTVKKLCICLIGYYQDVICDSGLWHGFIEENRRLYGRPLPFYPCGEDYMECELNLADVRFMTWYAVALTDPSLRLLYPLDERLMELSRILHDRLEAAYEEAPMPVGYNFGRELELHDPADRETLFDLGQWLFMRCYLSSPAFTVTAAGILNSIDPRSKDRDGEIRLRFEEAMREEPTGPLALYVSEWVALYVQGRLPRTRAPKPKEEPHPYYLRFRQATGGRDIAYFASYRELNAFLIDALGWDKEEEHLPAFKEHTDFVAMVNREKGLLLSADCGKCIADPRNQLYDKDFARENAFRLLWMRGLCPPDLRALVVKNGWLPDAAFPGTDDTALVADNADFIARVYLQLYYRGD